MATNIWFWVIFNVFVLAMLALDLGVFHRTDHAVGMKEASIWTVVWISLALIFNAGIYFFAGPEPALQFLTGYLIEKSLSVDNIFVFVMLFSYFNVPVVYQHRVLFWGILGALLMRGALIGVGAFLISQFHWVIYIFGAILVFTGIRMAGTASILVLIAAEMVGAKAGLGYLIVNAQSSFLIPDMYAGILTVSLLGLAVNFLLVALERHFSRWRTAVGSAAS